MQQQDRLNPIRQNRQFQFYKKQTKDQNGRFDLRFESIINSPINEKAFNQMKFAIGFQLKKMSLHWNSKPSQVVKTQEIINVRSQPGEIKMTWLGHASVLLSIDSDIHILIDPVFEDRIVPFVGQKRTIKPPMKVEELPDIDFVLISHDHFDHCNSPSLKNIYKKFGDKTTFLIGRDSFDTVPIGCLCFQMSWTQSKTYFLKNKDIKFTFVPACHWSKRSLTDQNQRLWGGFVIQTQGRKIYFAGDTGYCGIFKELYQVFGGFDLSLLPIGAYEPNQFLRAQHVNPKQAVGIHNQTKSKLSVGIHWGTFPMSHQTPQQVLHDLEEARKNIQQGEFITVNIGGSYTIDFQPKP